MISDFNVLQLQGLRCVCTRVCYRVGREGGGRTEDMNFKQFPE